MHLLNKHTYLGRFSDEEQELLPKARLYLLYEGSKTEELYFARLLEILKRKGLPRYLPVERCERIGKGRTSSNPKRLLEIAKEIVDGEAFSIDDGDGIALVFDADIYKNSKQEYLSLLEDCRGASVDAYVTYPSFELFLMLHVENSFERYIKPNERELIENKKEGKRRYSDRLCSEITGINPKGSRVGELAKDYLIACKQEERLNRDIEKAIGALTSNIGCLIERIEQN